MLSIFAVSLAYCYTCCRYTADSELVVTASINSHATTNSSLSSVEHMADLIVHIKLPANIVAAKIYKLVLFCYL